MLPISIESRTEFVMFFKLCENWFHWSLSGRMSSNHLKSGKPSLHSSYLCWKNDHELADTKMGYANNSPYSMLLLRWLHLQAANIAVLAHLAKVWCGNDKDEAVNKYTMKNVNIRNLPHGQHSVASAGHSHQSEFWLYALQQQLRSSPQRWMLVCSISRECWEIQPRNIQNNNRPECFWSHLEPNHEIKKKSIFAMIFFT